MALAFGSALGVWAAGAAGAVPLGAALPHPTALIAMTTAVILVSAVMPGTIGARPESCNRKRRLEAAACPDWRAEWRAPPSETTKPPW